MKQAPFASVTHSATRLFLSRFLAFALASFAGSLLAVEAGAGQAQAVTCPNPDPRTAPVWRNFKAFIDQEYASGSPNKRLDGEALAVAYGHALGRAALAQHDDPIRQEAVACLQLGIEQVYAGLLLAYGPSATPMHRRLYGLVQSTAHGDNDDLVKKLTGVTTRSPAYSIFGASAPIQPPPRNQPVQAPPRQIADGQHCASITADTGWQTVDIPKGFNGNIEIEGSWNVHHAHPMAGPEGYTGSLKSRMDRQYPHLKYDKSLPFAALLMRNGTSGPGSWIQSRQYTALAIGSHFQFRINDGDNALLDNKGALTVCMSVGRHGKAGNAVVAPTAKISAAWRQNIDYCNKGAYSVFSVANARRLVTRAEAERLPRECYDTKDYLACKRVNETLAAALDQLTQVIQVSRSSVGEGCRYCDLRQHGYSQIGDSIDQISRQLYAKGLRSALHDDLKWHFSTLEGEDECVAPPPKPTFSISPVAKDDCPGHCAAAAPACNYAYYVASTRACGWANDQAAPNLSALKSGDIWDRAQHKWLGQAQGSSTSHVCKAPAIKPDAWARMYSRGYGGGHVSYAVKQNHLCFKRGYSRIVGSTVEHFECRDEQFVDCSLKKTDPVERQTLAGGAYKVIFNDGKDWWTITPETTTSLPAPQHEVAPSPGVDFAGTWETNWGRMTLNPDGSGTYTHDKGRIQGTARGNVLTGTWSESPSYAPPGDAGDVEFTLSEDGKSFTGRWRYGSSGEWRAGWRGKRIQK